MMTEVNEAQGNNLSPHGQGYYEEDHNEAQDRSKTYNHSSAQESSNGATNIMGRHGKSQYDKVSKQSKYNKSQFDAKTNFNAKVGKAYQEATTPNSGEDVS